MRTTLRTRRILLDEDAAEHLKKMMATLAEESSHLYLAPSKAASWIISEYATRYFAKERQSMMEGLFNRKSFLKSMLSNFKDGSDEEIEQLKSALVNLKSTRKRLVATMPKRKQLPASESEGCRSPEGEQ